MFGDTLYSVGIIVWYGSRNSDSFGWWAMVEFQDTGHCDAGSIVGKITTKYGGELSSQIDTIKQDAENLGIKFFIADMNPHIFYLRDGETEDYPPPDGWREILKREAERIGFYSYEWA